jgi:nucleoside-diphosphate-sugar epimerase
MKILITGYGGYFATKLFDYLKISGYQVYGVTRNTKVKLDNIFYGDLTSKNFLNDIDEEFDVVIHCAANTKHYTNYNNAYLSNCATTQSLIERFNGKCKKFIYISTEAVFLGNDLTNLNNYSSYSDEKNYSTYSTTKKIAEKIIFNVAKNSFFTDYIIARPRLIWGGIDCPVSNKIRNVIKKNIFFWVDNGLYKTHAVHYLNLCHGINQIILNGKNGRSYFLTDPNYYIFRNFIIGLVPEINKKRILSINSKFAYFLACFGSLIVKISFNYIIPPINLSSFYLTLNKIEIDQNNSIEELNYEPKKYM